MTKKRWYHDNVEWKCHRKLVVSGDQIALACVSALIVGMAVFLLLVLAAGGYDGVQSYRAEASVFACNAKQMDSRRFVFTDSVVCVPYPSRRDTTAFEVIR